jgi:hypothetical protein
MGFSWHINAQKKSAFAFMNALKGQFILATFLQTYEVRACPEKQKRSKTFRVVSIPLCTVLFN